MPSSRSDTGLGLWSGIAVIVGSTGDENGSDSMKYWEIIADNLKKAGWSLGYVSAVNREALNNLDC
jgi:hypothetical protein